MHQLIATLVLGLFLTQGPGWKDDPPQKIYNPDTGAIQEERLGSAYFGSWGQILASVNTTYYGGEDDIPGVHKASTTASCDSYKKEGDSTISSFRSATLYGDDAEALHQKGIDWAEKNCSEGWDD